MTPLLQQMIDAMQVRGFSGETGYVSVLRSIPLIAPMQDGVEGVRPFSSVPFRR